MDDGSAMHQAVVGRGNPTESVPEIEGRPERGTWAQCQGTRVGWDSTGEGEQHATLACRCVYHKKYLKNIYLDGV